MASEHQALTVINLPFLEKRFNPGDTISDADFEEEARRAAEANPDGHSFTAQEQIEHFREWGSLGDPGDELHPDHRPVSPTAPTVTRLIEQARYLAGELEAAGEPVPDEVRRIADLDHQHVGGSDEGSGGDNS